MQRGWEDYISDLHTDNSIGLFEGYWINIDVKENKYYLNKLGEGIDDRAKSSEQRSSTMVLELFGFQKKKVFGSTMPNCG